MGIALAIFIGLFGLAMYLHVKSFQAWCRGEDEHAAKVAALEQRITWYEYEHAREREIIRRAKELGLDMHALDLQLRREISAFHVPELPAAILMPSYER